MTDVDVMKSHSFAFNIDDVTYILAMPLSITHSMRLRSELGISQPQLMGFMKSPDLDVLAICVWLARLQAGEDVTFKAVSDGISYESKLSIGALDDDHPESSGGHSKMGGPPSPTSSVSTPGMLVV